MTRLNLILLPSMLALALPGWATAGTKSAQGLPLNLSLPRDVLQTPDHQQVDETVERNLRAPKPAQSSPQAPAHLPYGAGYEYRHQGIGGAGAGAGQSSGGGARRQGR